MTNAIRLRTGFPFIIFFCFQTYLLTYTIAIYLYINVLKKCNTNLQTYLFVGFQTFKQILKVKENTSSGEKIWKAKYKIR